MAAMFTHRCGSKHNTEHQRERHQQKVVMMPHPEGNIDGQGRTLKVPMLRCSVIGQLHAQTLKGQIGSWSGTEAGLQALRERVHLLTVGGTNGL